VPIVQGLNIVSGAVGNAFVASHVQKMREGVERGESMHRTAAVSGMFTPLVLQMISVGEETGTIDELLAEVADFYDAEIEYDVERLSDAIEPILISIIGGLVLVMALGVFLPIWDLNTAVQG
jgi:MSHA biogenesis protein MshG